MRRKNIEKIVDVVNEKLSAPYSGGNQFQTQQRLEVQEAIDENDLMSREDLKMLSTFKKRIRQVTSKMFKGKEFQPWQLLNFQADYFCNTCRFECEDIELSKLISQVIRCAFLFGKSAIYFDKTKVTIGSDSSEVVYPRAVYIRDIKYSIYNKPVEVKIAPVREALQTGAKYTPKEVEVLTGDKLTNLVIFNWGDYSLGAYITIFPFVEIQSQLLRQLLIESFFFNKKWIYTLANPTTSLEEVESIIDPEEPLLIRVQGKSLSNKIEKMDVKDTPASSFIEFYKEMTNIYYELLGRRANIEFKKERNLQMEVESAQESFTFTQNEWLKHFRWFCKQLNLHEYLAKNKIEVKYAN